MVIVVMGVAGSGKTTVGRALAEAMGASFLDADDFHSRSNIAKMSRGEALSDADRRPWLEALGAALRRHESAGQAVVLACSALKARYRALLMRGLREPARVVYLRVDRETLHGRMVARTGHFMPAALLDSQLQSLEEPTEALVVDAARPVGELVAGLVHRLTRQ